MDAIALQNHLLELFRLKRNNTAILAELSVHDWIHVSFEKRYLLNNYIFDFEPKRVDYISESEVCCYLHASDGCPYKMTLIFEEKWQLQSLLFLCQGCFGEADSYTACVVCGGSGWGGL